MKRILLVILLLLPSFAWASKVALVIGNGNYLYSGPLPNAPNDATDMASALSAMGFTVYGGTDLTHAETLAAVDDFSAALTPDTLALFFYAGHGAQIGAENVVIPVDAAGGTAQELMGSSIRLATILRTMELRADRRVVILDACRNNPFLEEEAARGGTPAPGLARVEAGVGSYIAFSTQPGNVALDGTGRNSPFTAALLTHIGTTGLDIHAVMRRVRSDVVAATGQTQVPWENSSLVDELFLAAGPDALPDPAPLASGETGNATQPLAFVPGQPKPQPQPQPQAPEPVIAAPQPFTAAPQPFASGPQPAAPDDNPFATAPAPAGSNPFASADPSDGYTPPGANPQSPFAAIDFGPEDDNEPATGAKVGSLNGSLGGTAGAPAATGSTYMVAGLEAAGYGFLTLRDQPSSTGTPQGSLTEGTPLEVLQAEGDWVYVRTFDGTEGWAASQWIGCCAD
jgi:uncharacterized caspase-like protein